LLIDATERPHYRPKNKEQQRALYSGKRRCNTVKNMIISDSKRFIHFLGPTTQGNVHDLDLLRIDFHPRFDWFSTFDCIMDLGYIGFARDYATKSLKMPTKMTKKQPKLNEEQKQNNKAINQQRIWVEHAIGGMKRFDCLVNKFRNRKVPLFDDLLIRVCAGIWNLHLSKS
jgi:hypothetical protein